MAKIDVAAFADTHRPFEDMQGLVNALRARRRGNSIAGNQKVMSWGAHAWMRMSPYCLRFMVHGHHHKGHVYLVVNGSDLFDAHLTTSRGTIKKTITDIYLEDLVDRLDEEIERIPQYAR